MAPGIVLVAVTAVVQVVTRPASTPLLAAVAELVLLVVVVVSTVLYQAPQHAKLSAGFDPTAYRTLVNSNWVRTIAWTALGLLDLWLLWQAVRPS